MIKVLVAIFLALIATEAVAYDLPRVTVPKIEGERVQGYARVVDGDTLAFEGERVRLHGIDAPEKAQLCGLDGVKVGCGRISTQALIDMLADREVSCVGMVRDRYRRLVAKCTVEDIEINRWLVRNGYATAYRRYSLDYTRDENAARTERLGLWGMDFVQPEDYRRSRR